MTTGTATKIDMCGVTISLGDEMEVEYTTGKTMNGCRIKGKVIELWDGDGNIKQARLSNGWCFHDYDKILSHTKQIPVTYHV